MKKDELLKLIINDLNKNHGGLLKEDSFSYENILKNQITTKLLEAYLSISKMKELDLEQKIVQESIKRYV